MGAVVAPHAPQVAAKAGERRLQLHLVHRDRLAGGRQLAAAAQPADQSQQAIIAMVAIAQKWTYGGSIERYEAQALAVLVAKGGDSHGLGADAIARALGNRGQDGTRDLLDGVEAFVLFEGLDVHERPLVDLDHDAFLVAIRLTV